MKKRHFLLIGLSQLLFSAATAQGITSTQHSREATMTSVPLADVRWTGAFWGERFEVFSHTSLQSMLHTWQTPEGKGWNNFLIAAGEKQGDHHGPPFHDGDMYKWLEAVAAVYAVNHDPQLDSIMDSFITLRIPSPSPGTR